MTIPYTYYIYHRPTKQHYYGVRFARGCCPSDLWISYHTSSKKVKSLIDEYGKDSFDVEIRRTFTDAKSAIEWENKVLKRLNVLHKEDWLNQNIAGAILMTDEIRHKLSVIRTGTKKRVGPKPPKIRKKPIITDEMRIIFSNAFRGRTHTEEVKQLMSERASEHWIITYPDGKEERIFNLSRFCRDNNLNQPNFCNRGHSKGFKVKKAT